MSDEQKELRREIRILRDKQCYFFLSAAGASIGFATTQIVGTKEFLGAISINVAMVLWAASFFFGYRFLVNDETTLWKNHGYLKELGQLRAAGYSDYKPKLEKILSSAIRPNVRKIHFYRTLQVWTFFLGAIVFAFGQSLPLIIRYDDRPPIINEISSIGAVIE